MAKKRIIIPEIFSIANTAVSSNVARKILQQRVKKMSNIVDSGKVKHIQLNEEEKIDKLAKFNFLCGG